MKKVVCILAPVRYYEEPDQKSGNGNIVNNM